jgi:Transmembrane exosortase (Exosortase_EpsH)
MMNSRQGFTSLVLCAVSLVVWWKACLATLSLALESPEYSHVLLILPISILLILLRRRLPSGLTRFDLAVGLPILGLAVSMGLWASRLAPARVPNAALFTSMLALVTWWIGAVVLCFGLRFLRMSMFPIFFCFGSFLYRSLCSPGSLLLSSTLPHP